jgi:hypothetical protein
MVVGAWQDGRFLFSTGSSSRQTPRLAQNVNCIVCTEHAHGRHRRKGCRIRRPRCRRKLLPRTGKIQVRHVDDGILSMKEPVFAVRPRIVFALPEKHFQSKSTRWTF